MRRFALLALPLAVVVAVLAQPPATPKKYALLVGVNLYDHIGKLNYAVNDASRTADVLRERGFDVTLLADSAALKPTRDNILAALENLLGRYDADRKRVLGGKFQSGDTLLIGLAGHGIQFEREAYFCPTDGNPKPHLTGS